MKRFPITFLLLLFAVMIENLDAMNVTIEHASEHIDPTNPPTSSGSHPVDPRIIVAENEQVANKGIKENIATDPKTLINQSAPAQDLTILDNSDSSNSKPTSTIDDTTFNSQTMTAKLKDYRAQLEENIASQYKSIPADLRAEMELPCALALIDEQWKYYFRIYKVSPDAMQLDTNWKVENPSNAAKFSAGFDALQNVYSQKTNVFLMNSNKKTQFMSAQPSEYIATLRQTFPRAPEQLLKAYVVKYSQAHKYYDDDHQPIQTQPSEITKNPGWNSKNPTEDQKLYASIQAFENVYDEYNNQNKVVPAPSLLDTVGSAFSTGASALYSTGSAAAQAMSEIYPAPDTSSQVEPANVYSENLYDEYDDRNSDALPPSPLDTISQVAADPVTAMSTAASGMYSAVSAIPQAISDSAQAVASEVGRQVVNKTIEVVINQIQKFIDANIKQVTPAERAQAQAQQVQYEQQGHELAQQPLLKTESPSETKSEETISKLTTSNVSAYFADKFRDAAQTVKKNPEQVNFFIASIIKTFSWITSLSNKDQALLQKEGQNQTTTLIKDKNSWVNADSITFDTKFNNWMQGLNQVRSATPSKFL